MNPWLCVRRVEVIDYMRYAVKSKKKIVKAYCLGAGSDMEAMLIEEGAIQKREDGKYELFSLEAVNGNGEIAEAGDYFKVECSGEKHFPYPNSKEFFEENHIWITGDEYEQKNHPLAFWQADDPICEEIQYLINTGKLTLNPEDPEHYFNAFLWGADLSAAKDASVIFYSIDRNEEGEITDISFNFVAEKVFRESYEIISDY